MAFVAKHREVNADITIGCLPVDEERASDFGLMKIENTGRITEFGGKTKRSCTDSNGSRHVNPWSVRR